MKVSEIMTDLVVTVPPGATAEIARSVMKAAHVHHLPVMDGKRMVGILSERDLGLTDDAAARGDAEAEGMIAAARMARVLTAGPAAGETPR